MVEGKKEAGRNARPTGLQHEASSLKRATYFSSTIVWLSEKVPAFRR